MAPPASSIADPAHVVVAEEGRQLVGVRVGVGVVVVAGEEVAQAGGRLALANPSAAPWKPKSSVAGSLPVVVNWLV